MALGMVRGVKPRPERASRGSYIASPNPILGETLGEVAMGFLGFLQWAGRCFLQQSSSMFSSRMVNVIGPKPPGQTE
jgi:hypothetical protein